MYVTYFIIPKYIHSSSSKYKISIVFQLNV